MSQSRTEILTCPRCGGQGEFTVWDSINADQDPDLKEKLLDESLFVWRCPHCGHQSYITFGTLYHDMSRQFMLFFDHKEGESDISEDNFPVDELFKGGDKHYKLRYVHGIRSLKEKIFIFEEGLSDIAVELIKYFIRNQVIKIKGTRADYFENKGLFFAERNHNEEEGLDKLVFVVTSGDRVVSKFPVSMDIYEQCLQKMWMDERFAERDTIKNVCYEWIDARMKS